MSDALIGFVGVIAGALTTGGVQLWISWRQRRNDALASARIVWTVLADIVESIAESKQAGEWLTEPEHISSGLALWEKQRIALARAVSSYEFRCLDVAFSYLEVARSGDPGSTAWLESPKFDGRMVLLDEAAHVAFRASQTGWNRLTDPRREARFLARLAAAGPK